MSGWRRLKLVAFISRGIISPRLHCGLNQAPPHRVRAKRSRQLQSRYLGRRWGSSTARFEREPLPPPTSGGFFQVGGLRFLRQGSGVPKRESCPSALRGARRRCAVYQLSPATGLPTTPSPKG